MKNDMPGCERDRAYIDMHWVAQDQGFRDWLDLIIDSARDDNDMCKCHPGQKGARWSDIMSFPEDKLLPVDEIGQYFTFSW